jgi:multisubunit Na+/H+ antiporter MnhG subunit
MDTVHQELTNKQRILVIVLLLLGTLIAFGVVRFLNLQNVYSQPAAATKPSHTNRSSHESVRP